MWKDTFLCKYPTTVKTENQIINWDWDSGESEWHKKKLKEPGARDGVLWLFTYLWKQWSVMLLNEMAAWHHHYSDVIMTTMASQITSLTIVYWIVYSDTDQRKHQSSATLAFVWGIHRWPVNSPHKRPVKRKMFPFDDVIMTIPQQWHLWLLNEEHHRVCF